MNVVIIGGGQKFGKLLANKFIDSDANVYILSHKDYGDDTNHLSANFLNIADVVEKFSKLTSAIDKIDLLFYNTNADLGPCSIEDYKSYSDVSKIKDSWHNTITVQAVIPHILSICALSKMDANSKIVFMTSNLAFDIPRDYCQWSSGQPGGKASQNHMMFALSNYNDKNTIVYSIATHLEYEYKEKVNNVLNQIYNNLITIDKTLSGQIVQIYYNGDAAELESGG